MRTVEHTTLVYCPWPRSAQPMVLAACPAAAAGAFFFFFFSGVPDPYLVRGASSDLRRPAVQGQAATLAPFGRYRIRGLWPCQSWVLPGTGTLLLSRAAAPGPVAGTFQTFENLIQPQTRLDSGTSYASSENCTSAPSASTDFTRRSLPFSPS